MIIEFNKIDLNIFRNQSELTYWTFQFPMQKIPDKSLKLSILQSLKKKKRIKLEKNFI